MRALVLIPLLTALASAQPDPLAAVADALGGRDRIDQIETLTIRSRTRTTMGERTLTVPSTLSIRFPDAARWTVRLAGASRVTILDGPIGSTVVGDSARALPEAGRAVAEGALWLHPLVLAVRRDGLQTDVLADDLLRVTIPGRREPLLVGLDAAGRPSRITTFRRREGRRDYVEVVLRDYREVDGVFLPHRIRQAVRGVLTGEETVESVRLGAALTGAPFEGDDG